MMLTDKVWKLLEPATNIGEGLTRKEIEESLQKGYYKLFTHKDSACIISQNETSIRIGLGGGKMEEVKKIVENIEKFAKNNKINYIDILGRIGWEKTLKGYKKQAVLLRKEVT